MKDVGILPDGTIFDAAPMREKSEQLVTKLIADSAAAEAQIPGIRDLIGQMRTEVRVTRDREKVRRLIRYIGKLEKELKSTQDKIDCVKEATQSMKADPKNPAPMETLHAMFAHHVNRP